MSIEQYPKATQSKPNMKASASLAAAPGQSTAKPLLPPKNQSSVIERYTQITTAGINSSFESNYQQTIKVSLFFDGTGNNLEADKVRDKLSNVAKLFLSHIESDIVQGCHKFYVPGIGTYFKEINDPGGTTEGLAFGSRGQDRLDWAFLQFDTIIKNASFLATNPRNKIATIRVAAFGFSRGATLARAFAREFEKRCRRADGGWQLKEHGYPVRFYLLGLWDTVASVGMPLSSNNTTALQSVGWKSHTAAMRERNKGANGVWGLAFGQPGADPAPGPSDGHSGWAHPLDISVMVEKCVHMVAAHEIRNSFPLDSYRRGNSYPANTEEMIYPGAHSDVGGGYRPGEGARSVYQGQMLSVLPLRVMHRIAMNHGVPLYPLASLPYEQLRKAFSADEKSKPELDRLMDLWQHYMTYAGLGNQELGRQVNAHIRLYYGWRFYKIRQNRAARTEHKDAKDEATLKQLEPDWSREKTALERQVEALKNEANNRQADLFRAQERLNAAKMDYIKLGIAVKPSLHQDVEQAEGRAEIAKDEYLRTKAKLDTLPSSDGSLAKNLNIYDDQLMADAELIRSASASAPALPIRPHYRHLLDAYEAEFVHNKGLRDGKIIEFFDTYVHDSLAAFAMDATLPSDPRVIYVGNDTKSRHAANSLANSDIENT